MGYIVLLTFLPLVLKGFILMKISRLYLYE